MLIGKFLMKPGDGYALVSTALVSIALVSRAHSAKSLGSEIAVWSVKTPVSSVFPCSNFSFSPTHFLNRHKSDDLPGATEASLVGHAGPEYQV